MLKKTQRQPPKTYVKLVKRFKVASENASFAKSKVSTSTIPTSGRNMFNVKKSPPT